MPLYHSADHAMRVYLQLYDLLLQGFDPFVMVGREYEDKCPACKSVGRWRKQDGVWYCTGPRCGAKRPWNVAAVMKGFFQDGQARVTMRSPLGFWPGRVTMKPSARVRYDTPADLLADLGLVWVVLKLEEFALLRGRVELDGWEPLMRDLRERYPREQCEWQAWSKRKVQRTVEEARDKAQRRMVWIGLMDKEDLPDDRV